jgi:hypothetical protein
MVIVVSDKTTFFESYIPLTSKLNKPKTLESPKNLNAYNPHPQVMA